MLRRRSILNCALLAATSPFALAAQNLNFHLSSTLCFQVVKPFEENLRVHYDRGYLLNGGIPDELRGGLYFQGPHKVSGESHFRLIVKQSTSAIDEFLDSYLYVFFHKEIRFSGCLHDELARRNFTQVDGPGVPYDVAHGNHGIPSELWYRKLDYNKNSKEATIEFHVSTNRRCPFGVFGAIFTCNSTVFNYGTIRGLGKVQCPKGKHLRSSKRSKTVHFIVSEPSERAKL